MDAVIGGEICGITFMKKEIAHCGFPEAAFQKHADMLIDKGYRVARIEQVRVFFSTDFVGWVLVFILFFTFSG